MKKFVLNNADKKGLKVLVGTILQHPLGRVRASNGTNHYRRLRHAYESGGMPAVDKYLEDYLK